MTCLNRTSSEILLDPPLAVILHHLPEKGRKGKEVVEEKWEKEIKIRENVNVSAEEDIPACPLCPTTESTAGPYPSPTPPPPTSRESEGYHSIDIGYRIYS